MTRQKLHAPKSADIKVTLDGGEVTLRPTLEACLGISRLHNSPMVTAGRITDMDFDTVLQVLAFGMGAEPDKKLQERLFKTGLLTIRTALIQFVHVVNNGGRPVAVDDVDDEDEDDGNPL